METPKDVTAGTSFSPAYALLQMAVSGDELECWQKIPSGINMEGVNVCVLKGSTLLSKRYLWSV